MSFSSSIQTFGDNATAPDYVYYNADIINNTTSNLFGGVAVVDPQIRFNETRDSAIIKNAADYYFSIIRFTMNGANRDLPLFIPVIAGGTGQTNPDLTVYTMACGFTLTVEGASGPVVIQAQPLSRPILYIPETQNPNSAPTPRSPAAPSFVGLYSNTTVYNLGQIVSTTPADLYGVFAGPFFQVVSQAPWNPNQLYVVGSIVQYNSNIWTALLPSQGLAPSVGASWALGTPNPGPASPVGSNYWTNVPGNLGNPQDISSRYYWFYTYQHWVNLWNNTMLNQNTLFVNPGPVASNAGSTCAWQDTYNALYASWLTAVADPANGLAGYDFPYPTFQTFCGGANVAFNTQIGVFPPTMVYQSSDQTFPIYGDTAGFGERMIQFSPQFSIAPPIVGIPVPPRAQLYFNSNMFNLFANYDNTYYNTTAFPDGYTNEILFTNKAFQNFSDFRVAPYVGTAPLGYYPTLPNGSTPVSMINRLFCIANQDYSSVDSLWSPISSIVFTTTLLPVKAEATGQPNVLGTGNIGTSAATTQAAFQPIITDISLDTSQPGGNDLYRKFIYYAPAAEYRLSDFGSSKQDIRNIDIQVYWKNRLDSQLYPINMANLSSVGIKVMFKRKDAPSGSARMTEIQR